MLMTCDCCVFGVSPLHMFLVSCGKHSSAFGVSWVSHKQTKGTLWQLKRFIAVPDAMGQSPSGYGVLFHNGQLPNKKWGLWHYCEDTQIYWSTNFHTWEIYFTMGSSPQKHNVTAAINLLSLCGVTTLSFVLTATANGHMLWVEHWEVSRSPEWGS